MPYCPRYKNFSTAGLIASAALTAAPGQALVIDDFSAGDFVMDYAPNRETTELLQTGLPPSAVIGGSRDISAWSFDRPGPNPPVLEVAEGSLWIRTGEENWAYPDLVYGGESSPLNADFSVSGEAIVITVVSLQLFSGLLYLDAYNQNPDNSFTGTRINSTSRFDASTTPYDFVLPLSEAETLDLASIDQFSFSMIRVPGNSLYEIAAIQVLPIEGLAGDMDRSGTTDLGDVSAFIAALQNPQQYTRDHDLSPIYHGDLNDDGVFSLADIQPFAELLGVPASTIAVPEPSGLVALGFGLLVGASRRRA